MPLRWFAVAACALVAVVPPGDAHAAPSLAGCLEAVDRALAGTAVESTFRSPPLAHHDGTLIDARGVVWRPRQRRDDLDGPHFAAGFGGTDDCWLGGEIIGTGRASRGAPSGMAVGAGHATTDGEIHALTVRDTRDGLSIDPGTVDLRLSSILLSDVADSCVIADQRGDVVVDDLMLQRCGRAFELRRGGAGSRLTVQNSLIRLDHRRHGRARGRLFNRRAVDSRMRVRFENNLVATSTVLDEHSLAVIEGHCQGNLLVWLGDGAYPGELPGCFELVEARGPWRDAKRAWFRRHERHLAALNRDLAPGAGLPPPATACAIPEIPGPVAPRKVVGRGTPSSCTERALRRALEGGGSITFACGDGPVTIPIGSELFVTHPTRLDGGGTITLDGRHRTRIIKNASQLTLKAITLTRGRQRVVWSGTPDGGGAVNTTYGHRLYVVDSTFTNNRTSRQGFGGAIFQAGDGALTVVRSRFENNRGGGGGAIYDLLAPLHVAHAAFVRNRGTSGWQGGGGIMTDGASADSGQEASGGKIVVCGSAFHANQARATGAGAYLFAYGLDSVTIRDSTFVANRVIANEGGVSMGGGLRLGLSRAQITRGIFRANEATMGGAIATMGEARTRVEGSTFACNSSDIEGGNVVATGNTMGDC